LILSCLSVRTGLCPLDMFDESGFGNVAQEFDAVVDDGFGNSTNQISLSKIREFAHFDNIGNDVRIRDRHFVGQPGHIRAMGSRWRNEDLEVEIFVQGIQNFDSFFR
jgi:hypothetical protein